MADNQVTQWEYKYVDADENTLNQVGEKGWEVIGQPTGSQLLVKRPKPIKKQEPECSYSR